MSGHSRYRFELAGVVEFGVGDHVTAHAHSFFEMGFVVGGKGKVLLRGNSFPIEENGLYLIQPGVTHKVVSNESADLSCIVFHLQTESIRGENPPDTLPGTEETTVSSSPSLGRVIRSWSRLLEAPNADAVSLSLFARFLATEILTYLGQQSGSLLESLVERAKQKIEEGLAGKLEVSSLAEELGTSERTLRRHFQNELGCSVMEYIHVQRVQMAKLRLLHHESVAEVARQVGLESASQLSRLFSKQLGMSPKRWQQSQSPTRRLPNHVD